MENKHCYISNDELLEENSSVEHIIPNALGGRLKSSKLLTEKANNDLGQTIDVALTKSISLMSLLDFKRDRGNPSNLHGKDSNGIRYKIIDRKTAKQSPREPKIFTDENGKEVWEFVEGQENQILKAYKKKHPEADIEELRKQITYKDVNKENVIFFENHLSVISGIDAYRGVAKIAINYYVHIRGESHFCKPAIDFIMGQTKEKGFVQYYYPEKDILTTQNNEVSHVLHLVGDYSEQMLYCYIELFNTHNFVVVLNKEYNGPDFKSTYAYDLVQQSEIENNVDLNLNRNEINGLECPGPSNLEDLYFEKLEKLSQVCDFKIEHKTI